MKRIHLLWLTIIPVAILVVTLDFGKRSQGCAFCNPSILEQQALFEEGEVFGVYPYKPIVSGHILILPKRHVERFEDLTQEEVCAMAQAIRKIKHASEERDYLLLQKNGRTSGQTVPHVHFHYLPRSKEMGYLHFMARFFLIPRLKPLPQKEMQKRVLAWREAFAVSVDEP